MRGSSSRVRSNPGRNWALASAAIVGCTTALYLWIIGNESNNDLARVGLVAVLFLLGLGGALGAALLRTPEVRHLAAAAGTGLLLSMGMLAIFTIGTFLLIAAGLLIVAIGAGRTEGRRTSVVQVTLAFVVGAALPWVLVLTA